MRKDNKKGSIYSLMLKNYVVFTFIFMVLMAVLFIFLGIGFIKTLDEHSETILSENKESLEEGNYDEFPVKRLLGNKSFVIVLDSSGKQIYSGKGKKLSLTPEELYYVPRYDEKNMMLAAKVEPEKGKTNYTLRYEETDNKEKKLYVWDQDFKLIYSSEGSEIPAMNQKLFSLLSFDYFKDYEISKYGFRDLKSGQQYTLLIFDDIMDFSPISLVGRTACNSIIMMLFLHVLVILGFSWWLKRKITRPLEILQQNFGSYEVGNIIDNDYKGPKEFCDILDGYKEMAVRLKNSEKERGKLEEEKRNMMTGVAHDLKTPITVILGYAEALRDGVIPKEREQEYQNVIARKAKDLNELIDTFYEFNKFEHSGYNLKCEKTDICVYLRNYIAGRYVELDNGGFEVIVDIPETHPLCDLDIIQFRRVFDNIVNNTIKYNQGGTVLFFRLLEEQGDVRIILGDQGCGIPKEVEQKVFSPFVVGDAARHNNGSGLGLTVAKRIVEAHHGSIHYLSDYENLSTAFEIILPLLS